MSSTDKPVVNSGPRRVGGKSRKSRAKPKTLKGKVARLESKVKNLVKDVDAIEAKNQDAAIAATTFNWTGTLSSLVNIGQGSGVGQRNGDEIQWAGVDFRYHLYQSTTNIITMARVILLIDFQNQLTATSDLLSNTGGALACMSMFNRQNRARFKVLYDKTHVLDQYDTAQTYVHVNIPAKKLKGTTEFQTNTSTVTKNMLKILYISNINATLPTIEYNIRLYFKDM